MRASALTFLEPVQLPGRVTLDFVQLLGEGCHEGFGLGASLIEAAHFTTEISSDFFLLRFACGLRYENSESWRRHIYRIVKDFRVDY